MKHVAEALNRFLASEKSKVLTIRGPWGVGKTFFWNKFIEDRRKTAAPKGIEKYAYVSLFGLGCIEDVNNRIVTRTHDWPIKLPLKVPVETVREGFFNLIRHAKVPYFGGTSLLADYVIEKLIKNQLVCFDDLERKAALSAAEFTGLISDLTEQKGCKIVLIYNDQEVKDGALTSAIAAARDKLIDQEVRFAPTVAQNVRLLESKLLEQYALPLFESVTVANIRSMTLTNEVLGYFEGKYAKKYPRFAHRLLETVAKLAIAYYAFPHKFSLQELADNDMASSFQKKGESDVHLDRIRSVSSRLKYLKSDIDEPIRGYLENGYFDEVEAARLFDGAEDRANRDDLNEKLSDVWRLFHHSFVPTQQEFVTAQIEFVKKHWESLSVRDVDAVDQVVRELSYDPTLLTATLEKAIDKFAEKATRTDIDGISALGISEATLGAIRMKLGEKKSDETLPSLMQKITSRDSFNAFSIALLRIYSVEDFVDWLTKDERDTIDMAKHFLERYSGSHEHGAMEVVKTFEQALNAMSKRSKIDSMRVERFIR